MYVPKNAVLLVLYAVFLWTSFILINPTAIVAHTGHPTTSNQYPWWQIQSIDTMKYSRDTSREYITHPTRADDAIKTQMAAIAETGATHVAIATPYDSEFRPVLDKWVSEARHYGLKIWFRGNWAGWEGWFEYPRISRREHLDKTRAFIINSADLFEDGDIFTACPECENGGPGDPRMMNDAPGFRTFLIEEHKMMSDAFALINKNIIFNLNSMNGDVARLIMDQETTAALGGIVTIDHYVKTPEQLAGDIIDLAAKSGGQIVLGEFGAPIPDIHGRQTPAEQAEWMQNALSAIAYLPQVVGVNYWTGFGGSTALWNDNGSARPVVDTITSFFKPTILSGVVRANNKAIPDAFIQSLDRVTTTNEHGVFRLPTLRTEGNVIITKPGYQDEVLALNALSDGGAIELERDRTSSWRRFTIWIRELFD